MSEYGSSAEYSKPVDRIISPDFSSDLEELGVGRAKLNDILTAVDSYAGGAEN